MVEMCGGNTELIKTLNRIGAVAALETHRRLVTEVVEERGIKNEPTTGAFALALADLDQNAPYAGVYSGDQSRGWHGTTIQVVEPRPTQLRRSAQEYTHLPQRFLSQLAQKESIFLPEAQPMDAPPYSTSHSDLPASVISKKTYLDPRAPAGSPQVPMHHWRKCKRRRKRAHGVPSPVDTGVSTVATHSRKGSRLSKPFLGFYS